MIINLLIISWLCIVQRGQNALFVVFCNHKEKRKNRSSRARHTVTIRQILEQGTSVTGKNGPGKNSSAGPILGGKLVRVDQFWQLKLVRPDQMWSSVTNSVRMFPVPSTIPNVVFSGFLFPSLLLQVQLRGYTSTLRSDACVYQLECDCSDVHCSYKLYVYCVSSEVSSIALDGGCRHWQQIT